MSGMIRALRYVEVIKRRYDVATRQLESDYGSMSARYFREFWQRAAQDVGGEVEEVDNAILKISKGDRWTFTRRHQVMLDDALTHDLVATKSLIYELGAAHGWRTPRHLVFDFRDLESARQFMESAPHGVVVKPAAASRGNGITTRIDRLADLRVALVQASAYGQRLIVEDFIEGDNYRLLFLNRELIAAVRREPPSVTGDGARNIQKLMNEENARRLKAAPATSLIPLLMDLECRLTLRRHGMTESTVPEPGRRIVLKSVINQNAARENHTITGGIHPTIVELGRGMAACLNLKLFGMDLITRDIGVPLEESGGVVIEINIPPGLHYHDLVASELDKVPVGSIVLESLFSDTDRRWCG